MSNSDRPGFINWLGLRRAPDWSKARWLGGLFGVVITLAVGGLFVLALFAAGALAWRALIGTGESGGLGTGAVLAALLAAPFVIWRTMVAQKQADIAREGLITDRINTAVQGLGAEKTVKRDGAEQTEPNLEVRIGSIYALERIARDSDHDHVQIMEILCAYIRHNAPAPKADDGPELEMRPGEDDGPLEDDWEDRLQAFRRALAKAISEVKPRADIQTALTVIGRRSARQRRLEAGWGQEAEFPFDHPPADHDPDGDHNPAALDAYLEKLEAWEETLDAYDGYRLDLRDTDLRSAELSGLNLGGAQLEGAHLLGANLRQARLQGANLEKAQLQGTNFEKAQLQEADLWEARLQGADLWATELDGVRSGDKATLRGAALRNVNLTNAPRIAQHLPGMFGDASVTLPEGVAPEHWPKVVLEPGAFRDQWRAWLADPQTYRPPDPPAAG